MCTSSPRSKISFSTGSLGGVREHAQLDLRVVGGDQHVARLGLEAAADLAPERRADRDVLHVRVGARQPPGLRDRLQERRVDARALVDELRQHVEVGLDQRRELAPALDLRDDLVLVADRLQHARVGREAGLAAALARQAELLEQDLAELLRRGDQELRRRRARRSRVRARRSPSRTRSVISARRSTFSRTPSSSISRSTEHERQLDLAHHLLEPALGDLLALPVRERAEQHRLGGERVLEVAGQPALLAQLGERVAAPRRLEQVGAEQRVVDEAGRARARAPWRRARRPGARRRRATTSSGPAQSPSEHLAVGRDGEAPRRALGEQLALGGLARARDDAQLGRVRRAPSRAMSATVPVARRRGQRDLGRRARAPPPRGRRAPPPGGAAGRAARTRGTPRARASGRARAPPRRRCRSRPSTSRWTVASAWRRARPRRARAGSVCAWRR